ncbi:hypothetical protein C8R46DRAFT_440523 [Mycena filopes]|nr:hypothetical protein C8R46DRAFT_440523 [Mycena filopes]
MYTLPAALFIWALGYIRSVDGMPTAATQAQLNGLFSFNSISNMTTCEPALITWIYTPLNGGDPNLILSITNSGVKAPSPPLSTAVGSSSQHDIRRSYFRRRDITEQISAPIPASLEVFEWSSLNVGGSGSGWYALFATVDDASTSSLSLPFFVQDDPDVSCTPGVSPASDPTSSGPTSSSSDPISTGVGSGTPTSTGGPSSSVLPASSSKVNKSTIAGGVIGALVVMAAAITASILLCRRRRRRSGNSSYPNHEPSGEPQMLLRPPTSRSEYADAAHGSASVMMDSVPPTATSPSQFQPQIQYLASRPQRQSAEYPPQQQSQDPISHTDETDVHRMLAEQRAIEAEYARPTPWIDDSDKDPPNVGASTEQNPSVQSLLAEMAALRAQVARLEGVNRDGSSGGGQVELPPPAYDSD